MLRVSKVTHDLIRDLTVAWINSSAHKDRMIAPSYVADGFKEIADAVISYQGPEDQESDHQEPS